MRGHSRAEARRTLRIAYAALVLLSAQLAFQAAVGHWGMVAFSAALIAVLVAALIGRTR